MEKKITYFDTPKTYRFIAIPKDPKAPAYDQVVFLTPRELRATLKSIKSNPLWVTVSAIALDLD